MVKFLSLKELHRPLPPQRGQTSAPTRYINANTTAAQRLRALDECRLSALPIINAAIWWKPDICGNQSFGYNRRVITDLLIDGMLSGTGVRDAVNGGYLQPDAIGLSALLVSDFADWQRRYEDAHFAGFPENAVTVLDEEGLTLLSKVQAERPDKSVGYFSNGRMTRLA